MFPDFAVAKKYSCAHTMTTCLVKSYAKTAQGALIETLKSAKFALIAEGSNKTNSKKLYPIVVTYSDEQLRKKNYTCIITATVINRLNWQKYI